MGLCPISAKALPFNGTPNYRQLFEYFRQLLSTTGDLFMTTKTSSKNSLFEKILTPDIACQFIKKAINGNPHRFKRALGEIVRLHGIENVSRKTGLCRPTLHKMFSEIGNPTYKNLVIALEAIGLELTVRPIEARESSSDDRSKSAQSLPKITVP